ncbi:hypothetical protein ACHAPT_010801 [Fusarium lateritium]
MLWGYQGRLNIALEYKPEWGLELGKDLLNERSVDILDPFVRMTMDTQDSMDIWIVDYNLRRKHDVAVEASSTELVTFYARGRRLMEVDLSWYCHQQWEYIKEVEVEEDDSNSSLKTDPDSISFIRRVQIASVDWWDGYERYNPYQCPIGLLGWNSP